MIARKRASAALAVTVLISLAMPVFGAETLLGRWELNQDLTRDVQPLNKQKRSLFGGLGGGRASVSWGGLPIPIPGTGTTQEVSDSPVEDPKVLRCSELEISMDDDRVHLIYVGFGEEKLKPGKHRGAYTSYKPTKLTSKYETTTRKVDKSFEITDEGRLHAIVKLNPKRGQTLVYHRIFDRVE